MKKGDEAELRRAVRRLSYGADRKAIAMFVDPSRDELVSRPVSPCKEPLAEKGVQVFEARRFEPGPDQVRGSCAVGSARGSDEAPSPSWMFPLSI